MMNAVFDSSVDVIVKECRCPYRLSSISSKRDSASQLSLYLFTGQKKLRSSATNL